MTERAWAPESTPQRHPLRRKSTLPGCDDLAQALAGLGVDRRLVQPDVTIGSFVAAAGEPALTLLIMCLEETLSDPLPNDLIAQMDTLGELVEFVQVIQSRGV